MSRITILELFPLYSTCRKWGLSSKKEIVRLEKEFTIVTITKVLQEYTIDGDFHRKDGPAEIWYYKNGQIETESWWMNNKHHRKDGPSYIWYYENGQVHSEFWCLNNKQHRKDGPAEIWYYENGEINSGHWFYNGFKQK